MKERSGKGTIGRNLRIHSSPSQSIQGESKKQRKHEDHKPPTETALNNNLNHETDTTSYINPNGNIRNTTLCCYDSLPLTGLDILLIGGDHIRYSSGSSLESGSKYKSHATLLAEALMAVPFRRTLNNPIASNNSNYEIGPTDQTDLAIQALSRHMNHLKSQDDTKKRLEARHVHIQDRLILPQNVSDPTPTLKPSMKSDYYVFILSPWDSIAFQNFKQDFSAIPKLYLLLKRVCIVSLVKSTSLQSSSNSTNARDDEDHQKTVLGYEEFMSQLKRHGTLDMSHVSGRKSFSIPVLPCRIYDPSSRLTVARMILQRAHIATRQCGSTNLFFPHHQSHQSSIVTDINDDGLNAGISPLCFNAL